MSVDGGDGGGAAARQHSNMQGRTHEGAQELGMWILVQDACAVSVRNHIDVVVPHWEHCDERRLNYENYLAVWPGLATLSALLVSCL